jgi:hypothetical protein
MYSLCVFSILYLIVIVHLTPTQSQTDKKLLYQWYIDYNSKGYHNVRCTKAESNLAYSVRDQSPLVTSLV